MQRPNHKDATPAPSLLQHITAVLDREGPDVSTLHHTTSGMHLLRLNATTGHNATVYTPLLCMVLQGAKEVSAGTKCLRVGVGQTLLVSHTLPVVSRVVEATPTRPYVAVVLPVDFEILRSLAPNVTVKPSPETHDRFSMSLSSQDAELEDALLRLLRQCEHTEWHRLLAPITAREVYARLLLGPHAAMLLKLLWQETTASRIHEATQAIQTNLSRQFAVGDLARQVGMSNSAFFQHFKAVTGTTPLQYQKDLRLLHARASLQTSQTKVSQIAFDVGYESTAQFSREYARKFGIPPREDRGSRNLKQAATAGNS